MNNYSNVPLSNGVKEIILGSLLGDGSLKIHRPYKNARFSFRHSVIQKAYFDWKVRQLSEISSDKSVWLQEQDNGFSKQAKLRYQSKALEALTEMHNLTCKNNRLEIRRKWLNFMSPLSLAIWWFDDGSIISNGRKGVICTDGFDEKAVQVLAKYLQTVWKIKVRVASITKVNGKKEKYFRIWLRSTEELKKLLRIILPYTKVEEVLPKVILMYNDVQLQERWISEIAKNTGFSLEKIREYVNLKKSKWKAYRK
ncbi:hypothetical protein EPN28_01695 [Patescibacteria group bacterium]|nr:MAG: hypothetical protein EPN28_01695 [Patescibacteria group bacterium]